MSDDLKVGAVTLTADQAAMLRNVLAAIGGCVGTVIGHQTFFVPAQVVQDARDALALLPEPVDGDLVEAREMAIDLMSKTVIANGNPQAAPEIVRIREGKGDTNSYVVACLAAIRRGRALERGSREG